MTMKMNVDIPPPKLNLSLFPSREKVIDAGIHADTLRCHRQL